MRMSQLMLLIRRRGLRKGKGKRETFDILQPDILIEKIVVMEYFHHMMHSLSIFVNLLTLQNLHT
jgi:hypothetical protein